MTKLDRGSLERLLPVTPGSPDWDDVLSRTGAQQRRHQLIVALAAVVLVAVATASAFGMRALFVDKGFIGLPPEGAAPSAPTTGDLVLSAYGVAKDSRTRLWIYADGRLIWQREHFGGTELSESANQESTGFLEQRLTREGVEMLRSEAVATGLLDDDKELRFDGQPCLNFVQVRNGDSLVDVTWHGSQCTRAEGTFGTGEQSETLLRLIRRLTYPEEWLPTSAWKQRQIRAYVPSRFAILHGAAPETMERPDVLALLPEAAEELLRDKSTNQLKGYESSGTGSSITWTPFFYYVSEVATDEARVLAETLDDAGLDVVSDVEPYVLSYRFKIGTPAGNAVFVEFEPLLPHGEYTCSACG